MPIHRGIDEKGVFYQWGNSGKKYYYRPGDAKSRSNAIKLARRQAAAIFASGYRSHA